MATITLEPTYPIPKRSVNILIAPSVDGTNFFRVWATVAPTSSELDGKIKSTLDPRNRVEVYSETGGADFPLKLTFDKGGKYTFIIQEYIKGSGYGGGYEGDPAGSDSEVKNGSEYTVYVYIGQRLTQTIGPSEHRGIINVWVWDNYIRRTYKSIHGEDTPSITSNSQTDRVKSAIESNNVRVSLLNMVDIPISTVIGDLQNLVTSFYDSWNAHLASTSFHASADSANKLNSSLRAAYSPLNLKDFVNVALTYMSHHFNNDNSFDTSATPPVGQGLGNYHVSSDRPHVPIYRSVSSLDDSYGGFVDLHRCHSLHMIDDSVHLTSDLVNTLPVLSKLMLVHREYLNVIAASNPSPPLAQSTGAQTLISGAGFKE